MYDVNHSMFLTTWCFRLRMIFFSLFLFLIFGTGDAWSQFYYSGKTLTTAQGLSDNYITCMFKDRTGFVWIGTRKGLNRFDGYSIISFLPGSGNTISNEVINNIAEDKKGRIWVATMRGLNCYDPSTGKWKAILYDEQSSEKGLPSYLVWDLEFDKKGLLWLATDGREFCSYDTEKEHFTWYDWPAFAKKIAATTGSGYHSIQQIANDENGNFWLATNRGLVHFNTGTGMFSLAATFAAGNITDFKPDYISGNIFTTQQNGNVYSYNIEKKSSALLKPLMRSYPSDRAINYRYKILLASPNGLIGITEKNEIYISTNIPHIPGTLSYKEVNATFVSPQGTQWIGTPQGLFYINNSKSSTAFLPLIHSEYNEAVNNMGGVYFDPVDDLYFTGSVIPAAIFIIHRNTGSVKKITHDARGHPLSGCSQIKALANGSIWLLTQTGIYQYDRKRQNFVPFSSPWKTSAPAYFTDIAEDPAGDLWIGSFAYGYARYNKTLKTYKPLQHENTKFLHGLITGIEAHNNEIWFATYGYGVSRYNVATGALTQHSLQWQHCKKLEPLSLTNDITKDVAGKIWVATTAGGIVKFNNKPQWCTDFTKLDMTTGLPANHIISVTSDNQNNIWLLSNDGISVIDSMGNMLNRKLTINLFRFSGYGSSPVNRHPLHYNSTYNELLFAVSGGLLIHQPYKETDTSAAHLLFTGIKVNGQELYGDTGIEQGLTFSEKMQELSFSFAALNFEGAEALSYQYKLEGFDDNWQSTNDIPTVTYKNLGTGSYAMHVKVFNADDRELGHIQSGTFLVTTPFWQKGWFTVIVIIGLLSLLYFFVIRFYKRRLNNEKIVNLFSTSLYGHYSLEDIFWDIANNCIQLLGFEDCVIYQLDAEKKILLQIAAAGPKKMGEKRGIVNPIEIPLGKGIVGSVATSGKPEIIKNTAKDKRYIIDDELRFSEMTVPILVDGKVYAVIDSEHSRKKFFTSNHLRILIKVAGICSSRLVKFLIEEKLRHKIARDLHDEMGSTLTSINILSNVALSIPAPENVPRYLQKIKEHSGSMMESMSDIIWAINPQHDTVERLLLRMREFAVELLEPAGIHCSFDITDNDLALTVLPEERKFLYLIFKEALNNAVKYSAATSVSIQLHKDETVLRLSISDNGKGFEHHKIRKGNGIANMQQRAKAIDAELHIQSRLGEGTIITLEKKIA